MILESAKANGNHNGAGARKRLMEVFGRAHATLQPKAYSTAGLTKKQREERGTREVENPSLTLLAMTTPGTFFNAVGSGSMQDGFLNRLIIVVSDLGRQLSQDISYTPPPSLVTVWARTRRIKGHGDIAEAQIDLPHDQRATPITIPFTPEATALFRNLEAICHRRMDELELDGIADMYSRVREIAMKLALIVSQSCESETITGEHAQWAIDYTLYWADRSIRELAAHVADTPFAALCNEVAKFIAEAGPNGLSEADLSRKTARFKGADDRMRANVFRNIVTDRGVTVRDFMPASGRGKGRRAYIAAEFGDQPQ